MASLGLTIFSRPLMAVEIGLGARIGFEGALTSVTFPLRIPYQEGQLGLDYLQPINGAVTGGLFMDFRLTPKFSITPALNVSVNRKSTYSMLFIDTKTNEQTQLDETITAVTHSFDAEILLKYHAKWWYFGFGAGVSLNTKPTLTYNTTEEGARIFPEIDNTKAHWGANVIFDTGYYFPIDYFQRHHILLGWRTTFDVKGIIDSVKIQTDPYDTNTNIYAISWASMALSLGYVFYIR